MDQLLIKYLECKGPVIDSRLVYKDCMFFGLKGEQTNGNVYASAALEAGARYAVVDDPSVVADDRYILSGDVLGTLQDLAKVYRQQLRIPVIGLTGSNGKTTTKELIAAVLSTKYKTSFTRGNLNNHIGVPLTLLSVPADAEMVVVEMGANHQGEIEHLCAIAMPDFGLITNIGKAHLEGFGGLDGVKKGKSELYRHLEKYGKPAFVNASDEVLKEVMPNIPQILYGHISQYPVYGTVLQSRPFLSVEIHLGREVIIIDSALIGDYNLDNLLAAACIGNHFNIDSDAVKTALEAYQPSNHRSQKMRTPSNVLIMDAYNANPSSMAAALQNFSGDNAKSKVLILGEMLELGADSAVEHQKVVALAIATGSQQIFLAGRNYQSCKLPENARYFESTSLLEDFFRQQPLKDALILIKGSRGNKLETLLPLL